jgi:hypothetical protein
MPTPSRRSVIELSVACAALVASIASLFIARHQAQVMDRQLAASVWPLLEFTRSSMTAEGTRRASLRLRNTGIGPLRIRSFRVTYDGKLLGGGSELIEQCCLRDTAALRHMGIVTSYIGGRVVPAGEGFDFISVRYDTGYVQAYQDLERGLRTIHARYCYCSVLNDCWVRETQHEEADPTPVSDCNAEHRAKQFQI